MNKRIVFSAISLGEKIYKINDKEIPLEIDMVIPCYLIEKIKKYYSSNDSKIEYEVVPIISVENILNNNEVFQTPVFDDKIVCQNSIYVEKIFNNFEQGKKELDNINISRMVSKANSGYDFQMQEFMNLHNQFEKDIYDKYEIILNLCEKNFTVEDVLGTKLL